MTDRAINTAPRHRRKRVRPGRSHSALRRWRDADGGATAIEYALIAAATTITIVVAVGLIGADVAALLAFTWP
jgi:Flp pilus assembly pilin Flp